MTPTTTMAGKSGPRCDELRAVAAAMFIAMSCGAFEVVAAQGVAGHIVNGRLTISVTNAYNPLRLAIDEVSRLCACAIALEEAPQAYAEDLSEVRSEAGRRTSKQLRRDSLSVSRVVEEPLVQADVSGLLYDLLDAYARKGFSAKYLVQAGSTLRVIPVTVKNEAGAEITVVPVLDTLITLRSSEQTPAAWLVAIGDALSDASGRSIPVVMPASSVLMARTVRFEANSEPVHSVLARLLAMVAAPVSWRLSYDPQRDKYLLGLSFSAIVGR